jgi:hypothetical protein
MPRLGHHRGSCRRLTGRSDLACRQRLARRRTPADLRRPGLRGPRKPTLRRAMSRG